jgi:hypothetical protein
MTALEPRVFVDRPELATAIREAFQDRSRILLLGRPGSGRHAILLHTLEAIGAHATTLDLRAVQKATDVDGFFAQSTGQADIRQALKHLDEQSKNTPTALILRNVDGCSGSPQESAIIGDIRGEVQGVQSLSIFYTAQDRDFVARHFYAPDGAFLNQAVVVDVPDLPPSAVNEMVIARCGVIPSPAVSSAIINYAGMRAADLTLFFDRLAVHPQASAPTREIVFDILKVIALERAAMYDSLIHRNLSGQQRAILTAVAQGLPMRSDLKMVAATGIPANTLTSGIRSLRRAGWVMQGGAGDRFDDPFLRMHLLLAAGTKPI